MSVKPQNVAVKPGLFDVKLEKNECKARKYDNVKLENEINLYHILGLKFFSELTYTHKRVIAALFNYIHSYKNSETKKLFKEVFPLQKTIAKKAGCSPVEVRKVVKKLKDLGENFEQRRTKKGKFSSNLFECSKELYACLWFFKRAKLFNNILDKKKYKEYIKPRLVKVTRDLEREGSFQAMFNKIDIQIKIIKKQKKIGKNKSKFFSKKSAGPIEPITNRNSFYKKNSFNRTCVCSHVFDLPIPEHEKIHFSRYSEVVLVEAAKSFWWRWNLPKNKGSPIRDAVRYFQKIVSNEVKKLKSLKLANVC